MKKVFGLLCISALFTSLVSCADVDSRNNPTDPMADNFEAVISNENAESSSSALSGDSTSEGETTVGSSSSADLNSSSSVVQGSCSSNAPEQVEESSSSEWSSSSEKIEDNSSSSVKLEDNSSSSAVPGSSSSSKEIACGADKPNWKYLNSSIEYGCIQDSRDNQYYKTVKIGSQVWMAENLNYYSNTDPNVAAYSHCYENNDDNCETYGRLYTWTAAMNIAATNATSIFSAQKNHQGLCPDGFHIPTNTEIGILLESVNAEELKSMYLWGNGYTGNDEYGFAALPGGFAEKESDYEYDEVGETMSIWTTKERDATKVYIGVLYAMEEKIINTQNTEKSGLNSIRCLKDSE